MSGKPTTPPTSVSDGSAFKGKRGLQRLLNSLRYSIDGLRGAWTHEDSFRQEICLAGVMIPVALLLPLALMEKIVLVAMVALVLIIELINSSIEAAVDRDSLEINPLGKRAKDIGSAAVMMSLMLAGGTWTAILAHHYL